MREQIEKYKKLFSLMLDDLKTQGKRHKQIPNILTMMRLFAPFVVIPLFITGNFMPAFYSIIAFSLTDAVDGFIARTFHLTSELGKDLDTIADKLFATTLLISLGTINPIYFISLGLECVIGSICSYKKLKHLDIKTCKIGKIKTILLDLFVILGMGSIMIDLSPLLLNIMCGITTVLQVKTISEYVKVKEPITDFAVENDTKEDKEIVTIEQDEDEKEYEKTITYPHKISYGQKEDKKLVKMKHKK